MKMTTLAALLESGRVRRWHTEPMIGVQTVGEHTWGVAMLIVRLWPDASARLLRTALEHDLAERVVGDLPSPSLSKRVALADAYAEAQRAVLRTLGALPIALDMRDVARLRMADLLDAFFYALHEWRMGNTMGQQIAYTLLQWFVEWQHDEGAVALYPFTPAQHDELVSLYEDMRHVKPSSWRPGQ